MKPDTLTISNKNLKFLQLSQMNFTVTTNSTLFGLPFKIISHIYSYEEKLQTGSECFSRWLGYIVISYDS